MRSMSSRQA